MDILGLNESQPTLPQQKCLTNVLLLPKLSNIIRKNVLQSGFSALCLVSQAIYQVTNPILYENISLDRNGDEGFRALMALFKTLANSPRLARSVKSLHTSFGPFQYLQGGERTHLAVLAQIITRCPNLRELYIMNQRLSSHSAIEELVHSLDCATSLSHLSFELQYIYRPYHTPGEQSINETTLLHVLGHPSITSAVVTLQEGPRSPLRTSVLPTSDTITRLSLNDAYLEIGILRKILAAVPNIRHLDLDLLRYADPTRKHVDSYLELEELGNVLLESAATLESLKLAVTYDSITAIGITAGGNYNTEWGPNGKFTSLRAMKKLKSLAIPPEVIIGWDGDPPIKLSDTLPDCLERLCLRLDFARWENSPWDNAPLWEKVEEYLRSSHSAQVKHLTLACFENETEELEAARVTMTQLCNEFGVQFLLKATKY